MMNQMNHLSLSCGEVIHLPITQNKMTEIVAVKVAVERDQPALAEVQRDIQMMEEMAEIVVMIIHTTLAEVMTRTDVLIAITIEDTQYQRPYIRGTILLALWKWWNTTITICINISSS